MGESDHIKPRQKVNEVVVYIQNNMSNTIVTYTEDLRIAQAIVKKDEQVTIDFLYVKCYPLFKSIYDNYYTDCTCCKEFIDEMYVVVLAPSKTTGKCQMENFRGESTLASWLKTACLYYCYKKYKIKQQMPKKENICNNLDDESEGGDREESIYGSIEIDFNDLNKDDAKIIINMMPNKRYSNIILYHYLEQKSNEETAELLGMSLDNYYNKKRLAKQQYIETIKKEEHNGWFQRF